jgi:hypothetical protein
MPNWLDMGRQKKDEDAVPEITPQKLNETIAANKTELETKLTELGSRIEEHPTLKAMQEFLDNQKAIKAEAARKVQEQAQLNNDAQFENVDQTTREYIAQTMKPFAQATLMQQGSELRRSIFEDAEAFPYYTGALKAKIDALLDSQPVESRANPDIIRNVYKIVVFDSQKEIAEDKHKSRMSSASAAGNGTGAPNVNDKTGMPVLTQQMKSVAKSMGMTEQEYATAMKELQESGEYV